MNEVEQARAEFEALTGIDPTAHAEIEQTFDTSALHSELARAARRRSLVRLARAMVAAGGLGAAIWWAAATLSENEEPPVRVQPVASAPRLPTYGEPVVAQVEASLTPVGADASPEPARPARVTTKLTDPTLASGPASAPEPPPEPAPPAAAADTLSAPPASLQAPAPEASPELGSVLPEKQAWNAAREALRRARESADPADYQAAAGLAEAYLSQPAWQTFRGSLEVDRAEIALGAGDFADAAARLRTRLEASGDPAERKKLLGMLVLAESKAGTCEALRVVPGETATQVLVARCHREGARR